MHRHRALIAVSAVALALVLVVIFSAKLFRQNAGEPLAGPVSVHVNAVPVVLDTATPTRTQLGPLRFVGGWSLTADQHRFGGFSGLAVDPRGSVAAVSDQGDWFTGQFDLESGTVTNAAMAPFSQTQTEDYKLAFDAEALVRLDDGYLVAFEQHHRLMVATPGGDSRPWLPAAGIDFEGVGKNSGIEAISWTRDGKLLTLLEQGRDVTGRLRGWLVGEDGIADIFIRAPQNFAPADAATLPNGDILILARRFSIFSGFEVKLLRVGAADIRPGATLEGETLATFTPPVTTDNFEGLDVVARPGKAPLVYMISDNNFSASQRTLLMVFALEG